jgi:hypothetical protein
LSFVCCLVFCFLPSLRSVGCRVFCQLRTWQQTDRRDGSRQKTRHQTKDKALNHNPYPYPNPNPNP